MSGCHVHYRFRMPIPENREIRHHGKIGMGQELETGIELIDAQHRELLQRIDALELAMYNNTAKAELVMMIEYLESYVSSISRPKKDHDEINYPDFSRHFDEHKEFRSWYQRICRKNQEEGGRYLPGRWMLTGRSGNGSRIISWSDVDFVRVCEKSRRCVSTPRRSWQRAAGSP